MIDYEKQIEWQTEINRRTDKPKSRAINSIYLEWESMQRTDHQCIRPGNDKLPDDCNNCKQLQKHNYQHMDRHNVHLCRLNYADIQNVSYIRGDNLGNGPDNWVNMNTQLFRQPDDIANWDRMAKAHSQQLV